MAKKVSDVVMGMLSDAGSATRAPSLIAPPSFEPPAASQPDPTPQPAAVAVHVPAATEAAAAVFTAPAPAAVLEAAAPDQPTTAADDNSQAPRTLRLRPEAASGLRSAWLEAKRDDVLLTAQDFASDLVMEALVSRRRRRTRTPA
jgi:hypothetical protein